MRTREQSIYTYTELSGAARDRARDWIREGIWDFLSDEISERFKEMLEEAGFPSATDVHFSLGHVQGDGVTFKVKHFDLGTWLEAQKLTSTFRKLNEEGALNIYIEPLRHIGFNPPRVSIEPTYSPTPEDEKLIVALEEAIQESIDEICSKMTDIGYEMIEFRESDQEVAELAAANDYEFDEKGRPA